MIDEVEEIDVDTNTNLPSGLGESQGGNAQGGSGRGGDEQDGQGQDGDGQEGDGQGGDRQGGEEQGGDGQEKDGKGGDGQEQDGQDGDNQDGDNQDGDSQDGDNQDAQDKDNQEEQNGGDEDGGDDDKKDEGKDEDDKKSENDGDAENQENDNEDNEKFNSLAIEIAKDVAKSFKDKGYANIIESKGGTFMYLWEILFGPSFRKLYSTVNEMNGLKKSEIEYLHRNEFTYEELLEFDKEVAKKMVRTMRDYPNYFDVENAYGHILYDTLKKIGALNYYNFQYSIGHGEGTESLSVYNDDNFKVISFVNYGYELNKTLILKFDSKQKLTNFASLYSNDKQLNNLWIMLHQLNIELLPYRADEHKWTNSISYVEFNTIIATKFLKQLKTLQNAII